MDYPFAVTPLIPPNTTDGNGISVAVTYFLSSSKSFYALVLFPFAKTSRLGKVPSSWKNLNYLLNNGKIQNTSTEISYIIYKSLKTAFSI